MTGSAGIGNFVFICHRRVDECNRVCADLGICDSDLDFGHVAGDALAARRSILTAGVLFRFAAYSGPSGKFVLNCGGSGFAGVTLVETAVLGSCCIGLPVRLHSKVSSPGPASWKY